MSATAPPAIHAANAVPRGALFAAGGLALAAVLGAGIVRLSGTDIHAPDAPAAVTRSFRFLDRADGSIAVVDAANGRQVASIEGERGFVRGTLRGLARERRREGIGNEPPFQLIAHTDGRLTLVDPSTSRHVDLDSFGPTNAEAFAKLLVAAPAHDPKEQP